MLGIPQVSMAQCKHTAHCLLRRLGIYHGEFLVALMSLAMYLFGGLFCSIVSLSHLHCTCAALLLYSACSPFSCVDWNICCTGSVRNGNAQLCFSCLSFFLHFPLPVLSQECIEYASAVSTFSKVGCICSCCLPGSPILLDSFGEVTSVQNCTWMYFLVQAGSFIIQSQWRFIALPFFSFSAVLWLSNSS